jgi:predicted transglutaminase-like cysteine proteinase
MRKLQNFFLAALAAVTFGMMPKAEAGLISAPMALRGMIQYIKFDGPTLPPMAFTQFCLRYADECKPHRIAFRGGRFKMNAERWADLREVNRDVNAAIRPEANLEGLAGEKWLLNPTSGDCNDYAVTKRHELLARGWPARALLLSEVVTRGGEHHLVLVVRSQDGDLVLDSLNERIVPWFRAPYQWVRIQMPGDSRLWSTIVGRAV